MRSWVLGISELIHRLTASRITTNQMKRGPSARSPGGFCGGIPRPSGAGWTRQPFGCSWSPWRSGNGVVGLEGRSFWASRSFRLRGSSAITTQRTWVARPAMEKFGRLLTRCLRAGHPDRRTLRGTGFAPDSRRSKMDRTLATFDAQFDTLDAHAEGIGNVETPGRPPRRLRDGQSGRPPGRLPGAGPVRARDGHDVAGAAAGSPPPRRGG